MAGDLPSLGKTQLEVGVDLAGLRQSLSQSKSMFSGWATQVKSAVAPLVAVYAAIRSADVLFSMVRSFQAAEDASRALQVAIEQQGGSWEVLRGEVETLARDLEGKTIFADEDTVRAIAVATNTGASYADVIRNIGLIQDIAASKGMDLASAAELVGRAMQGNVRMLGMMFPALKDVVKEGGKWADIQVRLNELVGGKAAALAQTYSGQLKMIANQFDNMKEAGGEFFLRLADWMMDFKAWTELLKNFNQLSAQYSSRVVAANLKSDLTIREARELYDLQKNIITLNKDVSDAFKKTNDSFSHEVLVAAAALDKAVRRIAELQARLPPKKPVTIPFEPDEGPKKPVTIPFEPDFTDIQASTWNKDTKDFFDEASRNRIESETLAEENRIKKLKASWDNYYFNPIAAGFSTLGSVIFDKTRNTQQKLDAVWTSMRDSFIQAVAAMAARWISFQILILVFKPLGFITGSQIMDLSDGEFGAGLASLSPAPVNVNNRVQVSIGGQQVQSVLRRLNQFDSRRSFGLAT